MKDEIADDEDRTEEVKTSSVSDMREAALAAQEAAEACARVWEESGDWASALQVIRSGSPEDTACLAAKALGALMSDPRAVQEINEDKGFLHALFQVRKYSQPARMDHQFHFWNTVSIMNIFRNLNFALENCFHYEHISQHGTSHQRLQNALACRNT